MNSNRCYYCGAEISGLHVHCSKCGKYSDKVRFSSTYTTKRNITKKQTYSAQTVRTVTKKLVDYYKKNKWVFWLTIELILIVNIIGYFIGGLYGTLFSIVVSIVLLVILPSSKKTIEKIGFPTNKKQKNQLEKNK